MASWKSADLMQLSQAPGAQGHPGAYVTHTGSHAVPRVLYLGQDDHIHELRLEGGSWKKADLTELAGASAAADPPFAYETPGHGGSVLRAVYRGQEGGIHELRLEGGAWKKADLSQLAQAPAAGGSPCACCIESGSHPIPRVVYRGSNGHVHELRLEDDSWKKADLTELAGAAPVAGDPFIYATQQVVRVVCLGPDSHIQELRLEGRSWKKADLSALAGAPDAASAPFAYVPDSIPRVIYRGTDAHIHEVRLEDGSWKKGDLTALAAAPDAAGRPSAYPSQSEPHSVPRVVHRSGDGRIVELRLEGGSWKKGDLTELSSSPPAAGDPVGYLTPVNAHSTPRVVYRGGEAQLIELRLE